MGTDWRRLTVNAPGRHRGLFRHTAADAGADTLTGDLDDAGSGNTSAHTSTPARSPPSRRAPAYTPALGRFPQHRPHRGRRRQRLLRLPILSLRGVRKHLRKHGRTYLEGNCT